VIFQDIPSYRLANQQVVDSSCTTPKELLDIIGAIQAQDYAMARWAIGMRLPGSGEADVMDALDRGDILRTHLMRPTWHIVSAANIRWMLELTAPAIRSSMKSRLRELELSESVLSECNSILEKELSGGKHLTREELMAEMGKAKIATDGNRSSHILMNAELQGLICSGESKSGKLTYALLDERVPEKISLSHEEALSRLAGLYFQSHGPATLTDFIWWSGLTMKGASRALEGVRSSLLSETIGSNTYWMPQSMAERSSKKSGIILLPAFDEYVISYRDRSAVLSDEMHKKAVSENGLFRPVILLDGKAIGLWKRTIKKDKVRIEFEFFQSPSSKMLSQVQKKAREFAKFIDKTQDNPE
jgi:hypothetical protein